MSIGQGDIIRIISERVFLDKRDKRFTFLLAIITLAFKIMNEAESSSRAWRLNLNSPTLVKVSTKAKL